MTKGTCETFVYCSTGYDDQNYQSVRKDQESERPKITSGNISIMQPIWQIQDCNNIVPIY